MASNQDIIDRVGWARFELMERRALDAAQQHLLAAQQNVQRKRECRDRQLEHGWHPPALKAAETRLRNARRAFNVLLEQHQATWPDDAIIMMFRPI